MVSDICKSLCASDKLVSPHPQLCLFPVPLHSDLPLTPHSFIPVRVFCRSVLSVHSPSIFLSHWIFLCIKCRSRPLLPPWAPLLWLMAVFLSSALTYSRLSVLCHCPVYICLLWATAFPCTRGSVVALSSLIFRNEPIITSVYPAKGRH